MTAKELVAQLGDHWPRVGEVDFPKYRAEELGVDRLFMACHPDGADRGGYVVWAEKGGKQAYFYQHEWIAL